MASIDDEEITEVEDLDSDDEGERQDDVALRPGANADTPEAIAKYISHDIRELYEIYSYRHAA